MAIKSDLAMLPATNGVKPRKTDDACRVLKDLIITLQLAPGAPLDERALMLRLGIGRTPMREAIQRLAHEHLVTLRPRRGYYISDLSILDFQHMTAARELIEPEVARLAAVHITAEEISRLRAVIDGTLATMDQQDTITTAYQDQEFHRQVACASRNRYLTTMAIEINTVMLRYWYISLSRAGHLKEDYVRHHDLIDLLEQHDERGIQVAALEHIARFRQRMSEVITAGVTLRNA